MLTDMARLYQLNMFKFQLSLTVMANLQMHIVKQLTRISALEMAKTSLSTKITKLYTTDVDNENKSFEVNIIKHNNLRKT